MEPRRTLGGASHEPISQDTFTVLHVGGDDHGSGLLLLVRLQELRRKGQAQLRYCMVKSEEACRENQFDKLDECLKETRQACENHWKD